MWQQWVNAILGVWLVALAFFGLSGTTLMWALGITGAAVAILGFWSAMRGQSEEGVTRTVYQ